MFLLAIPLSASAQSAEDCKNPEKLKAMTSIERSRCNLDKIGAGTGFGDTQRDDAGFYTDFASIVNIVLGLMGIVATLYIIYAGVNWLRAGGNEQVVTEARSSITNAVLGLAIIFISYIIVNFVVKALLSVIAAS